MLVNPSYPIHAFGFLMAGGVIRSVPAEPTPIISWRWNARSFVHSQADRGRRLLPVQSDGDGRHLDFYEDLVAFAKKHDIFVLSDLAYAEVYFDGAPPPSMLEAPGAMDVTVEFTSMSKTFSTMAGWRMGFAVGNERLLAALGRVKSYLDFGAFTPIQVAAAAALNRPEDCINEMRATYRKRRNVLVEAQAGWNIPTPQATMFASVADPRQVRGARLARILEAAGRRGACGGHAPGRRLWRARRPVRLAIVENEQRIRQGRTRNLRKFFDGADTLHNVLPLKASA